MKNSIQNVRRRATALTLLAVLGITLTSHAEGVLRGDLPRREGRPLETIPSLVSEYDALVTSDGSRLRTILTRAAGGRDPRPGLYFVQWLSCDTVELPASAQDGWPGMMRRVFSEPGLVTYRTEKAGVGDSQGPPCDQLDYDTELRHHREALRRFRTLPGVARDRIIIYGASMGATMAPLLADEPGVVAVIVWGGGARTWFERTLTFERRRREGQGLPGDQITRELKAIEELLTEYLVRRRQPEEMTASSPGLAEAWKLLGGLEGLRQYGRSAAFHQQAQAADWAGAWERVNVPVLALFGENDWFEDPAGTAWITDLVNRKKPGLARFELIPGLDHHFMRYPSLAAAVRGEGGQIDEGPVVERIRGFLRERVFAGAGGGGL
jgi:pimeloyl-ACP methyl ester carboxylesterase